jgi:hypothetical protein
VTADELVRRRIAELRDCERTGDQQREFHRLAGLYPREFAAVTTKRLKPRERPVSKKSRKTNA